MRRHFVTLDVFTDTRFTGNPLAVVFEPDGLETRTMQAIAREFGHPETVFVLPPDNKAHRARLRIFTPAAELQFAGHPTVGAAVALARLDGKTGTNSFVVEEGVGPVPCDVQFPGGEIGHTTFVVPRLPTTAGTPGDIAAIAAALGLEAADIGFEGLEPARWSAGNPFTLVPLRSNDAIKRAWPDPARFEAALGAGGRAAAFLFCRETTEPGHDFHARMFAPALGVHEDPATGSAAAALAGMLATSGRYADGQHLVRIEQGYEMGRPSRMELCFTMRGGELVAASIGGSAVVATEGTIEA